MVNSSVTVNGSEYSQFPPPPPSRPVADSIMSSESADPSTIDDPEKSLSSVAKSMAIPNSPSISIEHLRHTIFSHGLAERITFEMFRRSQAEHTVPDDHTPELEHLCRTMNSRGLARLLESTVSDLPNIRGRIHSLADVAELRAQLQAALKLAPKPADLIYQCSNYVKDGETYVLMMELFVQMMADKEFEVEVEISVSTKQAAMAKARRWRNLYRASGGCDEDHRIQARGFLFFIVGFGISSLFSRDYIMNLIVLSYPCQISDTLRKAQVLVPMIPDMIKTMLQDKLYGEAIDLAFTFGIEDKFTDALVMASLKKEIEQLKEDFETTPRGLKEMEKAWKDFAHRHLILAEALLDHQICWDVRYHVAVWEVELGIHAIIKEARRVDDGKRDETEMETEMEHSSFAQRLSGVQSLRKRPGRELIICNLI